MQVSGRLRLTLLLLVVALMAAACSSGGGDPAPAVERYLEALMSKDVTQVIDASCAAWEEDAQRELDSFAAVETNLQDMSCSTVTEAENAASVACTGAIVATYDGEDQQLALEARTYRVVFEGGEWRMCGYE